MTKLVLAVAIVLFAHIAGAHELPRECVKRWLGMCVVDMITPEAEEHYREHLALRWYECLTQSEPGDLKHEARCNHRGYGSSGGPVRGARGWE